MANYELGITRYTSNIMEFENRALTTRPLFPVGVNIFVVRDGKLLLGKRQNPNYHDGEWGLPGGHLEEREQMSACAERELQEETGLTAKKFKFVIADNDVREQKFHYVHFGFLAEDAEGEVQNREPDKCYGWEWFPLDNLPNPLFIGHKKIIRGFIEQKTFIE